MREVTLPSTLKHALASGFGAFLKSPVSVRPTEEFTVAISVAISKIAEATAINYFHIKEAAVYMHERSACAEIELFYRDGTMIFCNVSYFWDAHGHYQAKF